MPASLSRVSREARACTLCREVLPNRPKPVFLVGRSARLLIVGQAPGRRVHETGIPWNDPSGEVLREWLALEREAFYDTSRIAIVPVGLCYPGTVDGVDLPPCRECAPAWQPRFRAALPAIRQLRAGLLPRQGEETVARGYRARLPRLSSGILRPAAPELAQQAVAAQEPLVRRRRHPGAAPTR